MELNTGCKKPWWSKKCQDAVIKLRKAKNWQGVNTAAQIKDVHSDDMVFDCKKKLRKVIKRAKKNHFQGVINNLDNHNIFQAVK